MKKKYSKVKTSSRNHRKFQTRKEKTNKNKNKEKTRNKKQLYEQYCQSHTCSGTINSSICDSDLTTTTSPLTSSAPYGG
jgi:hypothetical protein